MRTNTICMNRKLNESNVSRLETTIAQPRSKKCESLLNCVQIKSLCVVPFLVRYFNEQSAAGPRHKHSQEHTTYMSGCLLTQNMRIKGLRRKQRPCRAASRRDEQMQLLIVIYCRSSNLCSSIHLILWRIYLCARLQQHLYAILYTPPFRSKASRVHIFG